MPSTKFWDQRIDLAAAFRWAARLGWQSGICNHFSLAVDDDHILINPQGLHWSEITASRLLLLDRSNRVVEGEGEVEATAFYVHVPVHRQLPTARCILHAHTPHATALACTKGGRLEYCNQDALRYYERVVYDQGFNGAVLSEEEGQRIAAALGNRQIMFMAHHGVTVTGPTVAQAFDDFYYLEKACEVQILAMSSGLPLNVMDQETIDRNVRYFVQSDSQVEPHFAAIKRMLDRDEHGWRD